MRIRRTIQVFALVCSTICPAALAQPDEDGPPPHPGPGMVTFRSLMPPGMPPPFGLEMGPGFGMPGDMMFAPALHLSGAELSDEQVETLAKLRKSTGKQKDQIHSTLRTLEDNLKDELYADTIDAAKVKKLQSDINAQRAQLANLQDDELLQSAQVLTPDQRHKMKLILARMSLGPAGMKHLPREHPPKEHPPRDKSE
jgi:Spy/CpxP family protein refolding chaperone